jgi:hypothetical protein
MISKFGIFSKIELNFTLEKKNLPKSSQFFFSQKQENLLEKKNWLNNSTYGNTIIPQKNSNYMKH